MTNNKESYLRQSRKNREEALKGKFVIIQNSRYNADQIMYLQDSELAQAQGNKKMHWTLFLANAKGFDSKYAAQNVANKFRYNNVRIQEVK